MNLLNLQHGYSLKAVDGFIGHDAFRNVIPTA